MKPPKKFIGMISLLILGLFLVACAGKAATPTTQVPTATTPKPITSSTTPVPNPTTVAPIPTTSAAVPTTSKPTTTTPTTTQPAASPAELALGGQLYDNWVKAAQVSIPQGNSPLWASQTTNTRTGADTWRCKECHGWDYKGKDGAYGKGSHLTGFPGVYNAATTKTTAELTGILKGSKNPNHNFSTYLKDEQISALASFLKVGAVLDVPQYIDYATKKPKSADLAKGETLYDTNCAACHGADGKQILFGGKDTLGFLANDNPWEVLHKIRFGQPGAPMPSSVELKLTIQNSVDILSHAQTLP